MTTETDKDRVDYPWQKKVADLCTLARGPLALALVWLGIARGKDGVQAALALLLLAATLDTLDGYFARLSQVTHQTWIGAHDLSFDIAFSVALLLFLSFAGYLSPFLAALYVAVWGWIFHGQTERANTLAVIFQAPMYLGVVIAALLQNTRIVWWLLLWVAVMLVFAGRRFFHVRLPGFVQDLVENDAPDARPDPSHDTPAQTGPGERKTSRSWNGKHGR